jgi:hypothetical protein
MQSTTLSLSLANRRSMMAAIRSRKMAPWDEFADDAAIESDYYLHRPATSRGRRDRVRVPMAPRLPDDWL